MRKLILTLIFLVSCSWQKHFPDYPLSASVAAKSSFKIVISNDKGVPVGSGTAWIVGIQENTTYIMTAGHVCDKPPLDTFQLIGQDSTTYPVQKRMMATKPDLCLLTHEGIIGKPLWISTHDPVYGQAVGYVGAPNGHFGEGLAPYYRGSYIGDNCITTPAYPGASGSAVWTADGVVGVLVGVDMDFTNIVVLVPRKDIVAFTALAGFNFGESEYPTIPTQDEAFPYPPPM